jgi:hypothetical protein
LTLFLEVSEFVFGVAIAVEVEMHLSIVGLQFRKVLVEEAVHPQAIAVALAVGEVREHFSHGEAVRRRLPSRILLRQLAHEPAQDVRCTLQKIQARETVPIHSTLL